MRLYTINNLDDLLLKLYIIKLTKEDFNNDIVKLDFWTNEIKKLYESTSLNMIIKLSLGLTSHLEDFDQSSEKKYTIKALLREIATII